MTAWHFVGIGGAGMSVIAALLAARGETVTGSDARSSATVEALRERGVTVWQGHDAAHVLDLPPGARVVVSTAVRESNPELATARARGLEVLHRSRALAHLMTGRRTVAVAGAHGKTTTSAMLAVALGELGLDPSFAIGGSVVGGSGPLSGAGAGAGDVFVAEADESDGSFLAYEPYVALVTNVEPDHLDHFGSREAFEDVFWQFAGRIRADGALVVCLDDDGARRATEVLGQARVLDRDRGDVGELAEHARGVLVERAAAQAMVDVDAARDRAALAQRHREDGAQAQGGDGGRHPEPLVDAGIHGHHGLAGLGRALGDRPAHRRGVALEVAGAEVARHDGGELAVGLAQQQEAALRRRQLDRRVDHVVEDAVDVRLGVEASRQRQEAAQRAREGASDSTGAASEGD